MAKKIKRVQEVQFCPECEMYVVFTGNTSFTNINGDAFVFCPKCDLGSVENAELYFGKK